MAKTEKRYADNPAYVISLDEKQLQELGTLFAVWGQIDFQLILLIANILQITNAAAVTMLDDATSGALVGRLRKARIKITDTAYHREVTQFCERMGDLIEKRNHLSHGMWGWIVSADKNSITPGCHYHKANDSPLVASNLSDLIRRAMAESQTVRQFLNRYLPVSHQYDGSEPGTFYIGAGKPPDWIGGLHPQPGKDYRKPD